MPFPVSSHGRIVLDSSGDPGCVTESIRSALTAERPVALTSTGKAIEFRGGIFAGGLGNWHLLQPISGGTIEVIEEEFGVVVSYQLRFNQLLVLSSFLTFGLVGPLLVIGGVEIFQAAIAALVAWLWTFGMNYAMSGVRFRAFLQRAARQGQGYKKQLPAP